MITTFMTVFFITFILFCAVLKLRDVRDAGKLQDAPLVFKAFAYLTLILGLVFDALFAILLSPILLDIPQEWLTTDKVKRLKDSGNNWQKACAKWLCKQLSRIDLNHC